MTTLRDTERTDPNPSAPTIVNNRGIGRKVCALRPQSILDMYLMALRISYLLPILLALPPGLLAEQSAQQAPNTLDRPVTEALELWKNGDSSARHRVLRRLARLGPQASGAVPAMITGLKDPDSTIRWESAEDLHRIGPAANAAVPALTTALRDSESAVRDAAARALMTTKPAPKEVIPALVASLHAAPDRRCPMAVHVLGTLGEPAVPVLIDLLKDSDPTLRSMAREALGQIGPAAKSSLPALVEALRLPEREIRECVARVVAAIGPEAVEPLIRALRDRDPKVRGGAAYALALLSEQAKPAVPALVAALAAADPADDPAPPSERRNFRGKLAPSGYYATLRAIGAPAVPALLERLDSPDHQSKILALTALGFLNDNAKAAVPRLVALLNDWDMRLDVASALGGIGPAAQAAIPTLVESLKDPDPAFRARAAETLGRIGWSLLSSDTVAGGAVAPLTAALKDTDPGVRIAAARALSDIGRKSSSAIPELAARLRDPSADVRMAALRAFPRIGKASGSSLEAVVALLKDTDPRVRLAAAKLIRADALKIDAVVAGLLAALKDASADVRAEAPLKLVAKFGPEADHVGSEALAGSVTAGATLRLALADPDPRVRSSAAHALPLFRREASATVPMLTARLKDPDVSVRIAAATALGQFGPDATSAVPALLEALADRDRLDNNDISVAGWSAQALQAISPDATARMLDRLFALLRDPDEEVRFSASESLQGVAAKATPRLVQAFTDPKTPRSVKVDVLGILASKYRMDSLVSDDKPRRSPPELQQALPTLRALAHDELPHVRDWVRKLLAIAQPGGESAARMFLDAARDENAYRGIDLEEAQRALEPSAAGVLIAGLKDPDEEVRTVAAYALAALAEQLPRLEDKPGSAQPFPDHAQTRASGLKIRTQIVDALILALKDSDTQVRWAAAWSLYVYGDNEKAVLALIEMLEDKGISVRPGARIRIAAGDAKAKIIDRFEQPAKGELLRVGAIQALGGFGALAAPAVPALIIALRDDDREIQRSAAGVLAEIGPKAKAAVPELIKLLRLKDQLPPLPGTKSFGEMQGRSDRLALVAAKALGEIGPDAVGAIPDLIAALKDTDPLVRKNVAEALGRIGTTDDRVIPALIATTRDSQWDVKYTAAVALAMIGMPAFPALRAMLGDDDKDLRVDAAIALSRMAGRVDNSPKGETDGQARTRVKLARDALFAAMKDPSERVRDGASQALGYVGEYVVTELVAALGDQSPLVRLQASRALGFIGFKATSALDPLRKQLADPDPGVRRAAEAAIKAIRRTDP